MLQHQLRPLRPLLHAEQYLYGCRYKVCKFAGLYETILNSHLCLFDRLRRSRDTNKIQYAHICTSRCCAAGSAEQLLAPLVMLQMHDTPGVAVVHTGRPCLTSVHFKSVTVHMRVRFRWDQPGPAGGRYSTAVMGC